MATAATSVAASETNALVRWLIFKEKSLYLESSRLPANAARTSPPKDTKRAQQPDIPANARAPTREREIHAESKAVRNYLAGRPFKVAPAARGVPYGRPPAIS